jgi:pimeloyl-ACP methyl ester carboxylesterase
MARPILMPQVGQDLTEGKIVALHVKLGDTVKKGDIVAEVESEKATFEVEAFESGIVIELNFKVGDTAIVLKPLMMVGEIGEVSATPPKVESAPPAPAAAPGSSDVRSAASRPANAKKSGSSPLARRLAAEAGIEILGISGTGPHGAVVKKDVEGDMAASGGRAAVAIGLAASGIRTLQSGTGAPLLFIHGFGTDLSSWRPLVLQLGLPNPVLALDLQAHGANANESAGSFDALTSATHAVIKSAQLGKVHIAGHSLGAAVAASLAGEVGLEVCSLTLISPAGLGPKINGDFIDGFLNAGTEAALKVWLGLLVHNTASLTGALVRATFAAREGTALIKNQKNLASGLFSGNTQMFSIRSALDDSRRPVRIIVGTEDRIIPAEHAASVPAHVAVNRLPQVGHLPQLEALALTARLVAETVRSAG